MRTVLHHASQGRARCQVHEWVRPYPTTLRPMEGGAAQTSVILASAGYDHSIRFWDANSGACYRSLQYPDKVRAAVAPRRRAASCGCVRRGGLRALLTRAVGSTIYNARHCLW